MRVLKPAVGRARTTKTPAQTNKIKGGTPCHVVRVRPCRCFRPGVCGAISWASARRGLSGPPHHHHRVARSRHRNGYRRAPLRRETRATPRPARRHREPPGRRRRRRRGDHREGRSGWLYARGRDQRGDGNPTDIVQAAAIRSAHRLRADLALREIAVRFSSSIHRCPSAPFPNSSSTPRIVRARSATAPPALAEHPI